MTATALLRQRLHEARARNYGSPVELPQNLVQALEDVVRSAYYMRGQIRSVLDVDEWALSVGARDELIAAANDGDKALAEVERAAKEHTSAARSEPRSGG